MALIFMLSTSPRSDSSDEKRNGVRSFHKMCGQEKLSIFVSIVKDSKVARKLQI
jgi:hypothetical protein